MTHAPRRMTAIAVLAAALYAARRYYRNWGTNKGECRSRLPGDEVIGDPVIQVTEAVWIDCPPSVTWPWLQRLGQDGRRASENGGGLAVGDTLQLKPDGWMGLPDGLAFAVDAITPEQSIVLRATSPNLPRAVWSLYLQPHWATRTRLLARVRVGLRHPGEVVVVELVRPAVALLLRRVLLNIKRQVQSHTNELTTARRRSLRQTHRFPPRPEEPGGPLWSLSTNAAPRSPVSARPGRRRC